MLESAYSCLQNIFGGFDPLNGEQYEQDCQKALTSLRGNTSYDV